MIGGGSIAAMVQSLRSNRNLLKKGRKAFGKNPAKDTPIHKTLKFRNVPKKQQEKFLIKFKRQKRRENTMRIFLWIIAFIITAILFYKIIR